MAWLKKHWPALAAVAALGLLLFVPFIFSGKPLYASDQIGSVGWKFYLDALRHGTIPLWNPYGLGGMPTFDAGFGDAGYPLFILVGMIFPLQVFIGWMFVIHTVIAGLGAYFLVSRFFGLDRLLSLGLAAAYMLNTNFISHVHAGHTGKFYIMAWLPLSLYFLLRSLTSKARWYHALGLALTLTVFMTCNHPQLSYFVLMGYFLLWAWKTVLLVREKRRAQAALAAGRFWGPILLGIGLAFFMLYPPLQWTKHHGIRGEEKEGPGSKTSYEHATSWSMHPEETASLIVPEFTGLNDKYWGRNVFKLNSEYPGLSVLFLAILGLVLYRKERGWWFWAWGGLGALAIVFGLGAHTPLFRLFYAAIPGIKNFRAPSMMLFWLATALFIMSADTLSRLSQGVPEKERAKWARRTLRIGLGAAGALLLMGVLPDMAFGLWKGLFGGEPWQNLAQQEANKGAFAGGAIKNALLLAALVYGTWRWLLKETFPLRFGWVLLAVTLIDLYWIDANFIKTYDPDRFLGHEPTVEALKADTSRYRVFGLPGTYERWQMQYREIETADGWTDNEYRIYRELRGGDYMQNPHFMAGIRQNPDGTVAGSNVLDRLNVKYLAYRLQGEGFFRVAPNLTARPRAWVAESWEILPDSQALARLTSPGFDAASRVSVSPTTPLPEGFPPAGEAAAASAADTAARADTAAPAAASAAQASVAELEREYNRLAYKAELPRRGILVLSELWFPHWEVSVDGKPAPLLRVDYGFRGVALEAGAHEVSLEYRSPWLRKGFLIAGLSVLLLGAGLAGLRFAERGRS